MVAELRLRDASRARPLPGISQFPAAPGVPWLVAASLPSPLLSSHGCLPHVSVCSSFCKDVRHTGVRGLPCSSMTLS